MAGAIILSAAALFLAVGLALCLKKDADKYVSADAILLERLRSDTTGYTVPIVSLDTGNGPRRAVCHDISRKRFTATPGERVRVIYKPRGDSGYADLCVDTDGNAAANRQRGQRIIGGIIIFTGIILLSVAIAIICI